MFLFLSNLSRRYLLSVCHVLTQAHSSAFLASYDHRIITHCRKFRWAGKLKTTQRGSVLDGIETLKTRTIRRVLAPPMYHLLLLVFFAAVLGQYDPSVKKRRKVTSLFSLSSSPSAAPFRCKTRPRAPCTSTTLAVSRSPIPTRACSWRARRAIRHGPPTSTYAVTHRRSDAQRPRPCVKTTAHYLPSMFPWEARPAGPCRPISTRLRDLRR